MARPALRAVQVPLLALVLLGACATADPHRRAKTGAAIGAVAGAVAGHQMHDRNGRYVGAAVGVLTGAAIGHYMDRQQTALEDRLAAERAGQRIRVERLDEQTLKLDLDSEVTFDINSAAIRDDFEDSLRKVADVIGEYERTAVHVIGHTDSTGSESYNQQLSERRADAVGHYLGRYGVHRSRLRMSGRGELQPIADNRDKAGRSRNRRVEIYLKTLVDGREDEAFWPPA